MHSFMAWRYGAGGAKTTCVDDGIDDAVESVDVSVFTKLDVPFIFQFPVVCVSGEGLKGRGVLFWR